MRVAEQAVDEHQRADGQARRSENLPQMLELLLQRRVLGLERLDHLGDETDLGVHARAGHEPLAASVGDQRAHEGGVLAVAQRYFLVQHHPGILLDRHRFAGQRGLLDLEIDALDQPQIGGNIVSGFQQHDVAADDLAARNRHLLAVADDLGIRGGHLLQGRERLFRLRFLDDADHRVEHHDEHDGDGIDVLAERQRNQRRDDQNDHEVIVELIQKEGEESRLRPLGQFVGAEASQDAPALPARVRPRSSASGSALTSSSIGLPCELHCLA